SAGLGAARLGRSLSARNTTAESGGTVNESEPFAALFGGAPTPYRTDHVADGVAVAIVNLPTAVPELSAATYSRPAARSIRLTAKGRFDASRGIVAPVESAAWESRSSPSDRSSPSIGLVTSNEEPFPIGGEPTLSWVFHSATCVGNMSWRAAWSPPRPIIPTSSP